MGCACRTIVRIIFAVLCAGTVVAGIVGGVVIFKQYLDSPWKLLLSSAAPAFALVLCVGILAAISGIIGLSSSCCCRCCFCFYIIVVIVCIIVEVVCLAVTSPFKKKSIEVAGVNWYTLDGKFFEHKNKFEVDNKCCGYGEEVLDYPGFELPSFSPSSHMNTKDIIDDIVDGVGKGSIKIYDKTFCAYNWEKLPSIGGGDEDNNGDGEEGGGGGDDEGGDDGGDGGFLPFSKGKKLNTAKRIKIEFDDVPSCGPILRDKINKSYQNLIIVTVVILILSVATMVLAFMLMCCLKKSGVSAAESDSELE